MRNNLYSLAPAHTGKKQQPWPARHNKQNIESSSKWVPLALRSKVWSLRHDLQPGPCSQRQGTATVASSSWQTENWVPKQVSAHSSKLKGLKFEKQPTAWPLLTQARNSNHGQPGQGKFCADISRWHVCVLQPVIVPRLLPPCPILDSGTILTSGTQKCHCRISGLPAQSLTLAQTLLVAHKNVTAELADNISCLRFFGCK